MDSNKISAKQLAEDLRQAKEITLTLLDEIQYYLLQYTQYFEIVKNLNVKLERVYNQIPLQNTVCREQIKQCLYLLKRYTNKNIWNEFKIRFASIHPGFYDQLIIQYPQLTENDLRLCAFIKLKMTTKEIAGILNQRVNSIKVARKRLRSKLNIGNRSETLIGLMSQIYTNIT